MTTLLCADYQSNSSFGEQKKSQTHSEAEISFSFCVIWELLLVCGTLQIIPFENNSASRLHIVYVSSSLLSAKDI